MAGSEGDRFVFGKSVAEQAALARWVIRCEGNLVGGVARLTRALSRFFPLLDSDVPQGGVERIDGQLGSGGRWGLQQDPKDASAP